MTELFQDSDPEVGESGSRSRQSRAERRRQQQRRAQRRRTLVSFVVMVVALGLLVAGAWVFIRPLLTDRGDPSPSLHDYPGPGSGSAEIVVNPGDSGAAIGSTLVQADVVASVEAFVAAYNANAEAPGIQPGSYTLVQQIPAAQAVEALLDPTNRTDDAVTIPEGMRATQIYARVADRLEIDVAEVEDAAAELTLPEEAGGEIEGWLFPSTYSIGPDSDARSILQQMVDMTVAVLERNDVPSDAWYEVLTTASIVEKEVARPDDRPLVAQVIENRLAGCDGTGTIGMDSTLVYELEKPASEITGTEWNTATAYNTREVTGLPPTPIASPGEAAIAAAANPPEGDFCWFVTVNLETGETKFTGDYQEFLEFREEYKQWREENGR